MSLVGQSLGQYRIVEFIGAGGMASVYKAYQASLDRHVAVKVLPAQHALTAGFKERFTLEARAVAQLSHPNILPIYDFGLDGDLSYFVMKYVPGHTLADLLGRSLDLTAASHYIGQAAGALDHAHERGILHRDVKPANMLLEGDWLLLADFGMAKLTESTSAITSSGHVFGTPAYISPEQADGKPMDHRTDIYSLGIVLYEMVVGRVPYPDPAPMRVIFKQIYEAPPLPRSLNRNLPEAVERVILKALSKDPADRYARAGELAEALQSALAEAAQPAPARSKRQPKTPAAPRTRKNSRSQPVKAATAAAAPARPKKAAPAKSQPTPLTKPERSVSTSGMFVVGGTLLALLIVGLLFFFTGSGDADGFTLGSPTPGDETQTIIATPVETTEPTPADTPVPPPATVAAVITPEGTTPPVTPTSELAAAISGRLAIPVVLGAEFRVYLTGFDGAGINGPTPVSLVNARQPMFRPDGGAVIVNGALTGAFRGIFNTDAQGLDARPFNDRGDAYWPVWSPDGSEFMFVDLNRNRGLLRQNSQLAASEADFRPVQANDVNLTGNNLLWSDDNQLVFQGCAGWLGQFGECGIWATDADTVDPIRVTANTGLPTDVANGRITYMSAQDGDWEIYLVPLAGGQSANLTNNDSQDGLAAIAPDGQSVAYISNESGSWAVWTITLSDNQKQKWFDLDPQRGTIDVNSWSEERMSWTR